MAVASTVPSFAPKVTVLGVEAFEQPFRLRLPFRFGVITVTEGVQAFLREYTMVAGKPVDTGKLLGLDLSTQPSFSIGPLLCLFFGLATGLFARPNVGIGYRDSFEVFLLRPGEGIDLGM
jgi:hypothetical protein